MTPQRFKEDLQRFDKRLDIEFNGEKMRWEIVGRDLKNKKYLIKSIPLGQMDTLGPATLQELYDCSPIKQGGAKELNRKIDEQIEKEEAAEEREMQNRIEERIEDAWQHLQYRNGYRISLHVPNQTEPLVINDKRRVSA